MGKPISRYCFFLFFFFTSVLPVLGAGSTLLHAGFLLIAVIRGYSLVAEYGLLAAVASFVERGLYASRLQ